MLEAVTMVAVLPMRKLLELCFQCSEDDYECCTKAEKFAPAATILVIVTLIILIYIGTKK